MARQLREQGHKVTLFLVQNGALGARPSPAGESLQTLANDGVEILVDDFSLKERGIATSDMAANISTAPLDRILDDLAAGYKVLWQ